MHACAYVCALLDPRLIPNQAPNAGGCLQGFSTFSATLLAFTFIFGNAVKNMFEAMLFLFVEHAFDGVCAIAQPCCACKHAFSGHARLSRAWFRCTHMHQCPECLERACFNL